MTAPVVTRNALRSVLFFIPEGASENTISNVNAFSPSCSSGKFAKRAVSGVATTAIDVPAGTVAYTPSESERPSRVHTARE